MTSDAVAVSERLAHVRSGIGSAATQAGTDVAALTLIVVTKFHPASLVRELHGLGVTDVGESRHQEASAKSAELTDLPLTWHFVGQLQSKKARQVMAYTRVIHSVDRTSLVSSLAGLDTSVEVFLQVNLTDDLGRGGVQPPAIPALAESIVATPGLTLLGVMAVAPIDEEPRSAFARLRVYGDRVRQIEPAAVWMSAGMSNDYREAILEGATHLRIGSAITGNRPPHG